MSTLRGALQKVGMSFPNALQLKYNLFLEKIQSFFHREILR